MARIFRFLLFLLTASIFQGSIEAYTCTFANKTQATVVVQFYKMNSKLKTESSGDITILPKSENKWDAGKCLKAFPCSISGFKIIKMTVPGKSATESTTTVPGADKIQEKWTGLSAHAADQTWELTEDHVPDVNGKLAQVQFTLTRKPAGVRGTTYPGGKIWASDRIDIQLINSVKGFVPKNDAEKNESCYAYLTGDPKEIFKAMCGNPRPFKINTNGKVPKVYGSKREDVIAQIAKEKGPEKYYDPAKGHGTRPSMSHFQTIKILRNNKGGAL